MPVYRYKCECEYKHDQYLKVDRDSILLRCENCTRTITARQVRDNTVKFAENNGVTGVLRDEKK